MKDKSQLKQISLTTVQLVGLLGIFLLLGFLLPTYLAPYVADLFGITTPYEAARQTMSVQISNRNANNGEVVTIGVSDPAAAVRIDTLSYSCDYPEITLAYRSSGNAKRIPCDTELALPSATTHEIMVLTNKNTLTYLPVDLLLKTETQSGRLSVVIGAAVTGSDEKSQLFDTITTTLQSFPASQ
jgi:hypothetical protein